jgi:NADP-dependent 3-hydroxy acid dehydrogenase YdfG
MEIEGRVAVVTWAVVGTGRAIALALAAAGADVVASDVDEEGGMETVTQAEGRMSFVRAGITVPDDVRRLITSAGPQILINNAGGGGHIPPHFPEATPNQWGATLELNLHGPMLATQLALEHMGRTGGGAVVNVASTAGLGLEPYQSPEYGAAKAGLIRFTSALGRTRRRACELHRPGLGRDRARERSRAGDHATANPACGRRRCGARTDSRRHSRRTRSGALAWASPAPAVSTRGRGSTREHDQIAVGIGDPSDPLAPRHVLRIGDRLESARSGPHVCAVDVFHINAKLNPVAGRRPLRPTVQRLAGYPAESDL